MSNDNYRPLLNLSGDSYYTAAQAGPFNESANVAAPAQHLSFAAFCAFIIDPTHQQGTVDLNSPPIPQWLWGNFDTTNKAGRGWSLTLEASPAGQLDLIARSTAATGLVLEARETISGAGTTSPYGNVIFATLWYQGGAADSTVMLGINGSLVAYSNSLVAGGYLPSPFAARLGADPVTAIVGMGAFYIDFIACGFSPVPLTITGDAIDAEFIGSSWRGFYEAWGNSNYLLQAHGYDWKHRYDVLSLAQGLSGTLTKTPQGAYLPVSGVYNENYPVPAAVMNDLGNQSPDPAFRVTPFTPVPLNRTSPPAPGARLLGTKNTPFYQPQAFVFPTTPPP